MQEDIEYAKAMSMLNSKLNAMKDEINEVDQTELGGSNKVKANDMHKIYEEIDILVKKYADSHNQTDFCEVCQLIEALQPTFTLNYNEILH